MRVAVVGPCASGKTHLVERLRRSGLEAYTVAQEHSEVSDFFGRRHPDVVVYLDVGCRVLRKRRRLSSGPGFLARQRKRLARARLEADIYILTDDLEESEVYDQVMLALDLSREGKEGRGPDPDPGPADRPVDS